MLDFTVRFILATLKLIFKVTLIIGGLVFSSLGNAFLTMLNDESHKTDEAGDLERFARRASVCDEISATQAYYNGDITASELVNYQDIK